MHFADFTHVVTLPMCQTSLSIPYVDGENDAQSTEDNHDNQFMTLSSALACLYTQPLAKHWEKGGTGAGTGLVISKEKATSLQHL